MVTLAQVRKALKARFPDIDAQALEETPSRRIVGVVISKVFADLDHPDRQKKLWRVLDEKFSRHEAANVGPIAALSPEEAELRAADVD